MTVHTGQLPPPEYDSHSPKASDEVTPQSAAEPRKTPDPPRTTKTARKPVPDALRQRQPPHGSHCGPECVRPTAAQAHCPVCHATFGGVSNFDKHRRNGFCLDIAELGLVEDERHVWRGPTPENAWWRAE